MSGVYPLRPSTQAMYTTPVAFGTTHGEEGALPAPTTALPSVAQLARAEGHGKRTNDNAVATSVARGRQRLSIRDSIRHPGLSAQPAVCT